MSHDKHLDDILRDWPYDPGAVSVRMTTGSDGRSVIQMRIELGLLQMETTGRPDGEQPGGSDSYCSYLMQLESQQGSSFELTTDQCFECDREFVQFYHRRICWLALQQYAHAVQDADHTLQLMDLCLRHSSDDAWKLSHEQYRPFVMYHRIQAFAMQQLANGAPEEAVQSINRGLEQLRQLFEKYQLDEQFEDDDLVARLVDLRESLRDQFDVGRTLHEQLADAIAAEQYELAAQLRDRLRGRPGRR